MLWPVVWCDGTTFQTVCLELHFENSGSSIFRNFGTYITHNVVSYSNRL